MKKTVRIVCTILISVLLFTVSGCADPIGRNNDRNISDAVTDATAAFSLDEVVYCSGGSADCDLLLQKEFKFVYYIVGEKNGSEIFIAAPADSSIMPYEIEWPFSVTYKKIVEMIETQLGIAYVWDIENMKLRVVCGKYDPPISELHAKYDFLFFFQLTHETSHGSTSFFVCQKAGECVLLDYQDFLGAECT